MPHEGEGNKPYEKRVSITEAERQAIATAKVALTDAFAELFKALGINYANEESMEEFRKDLKFLRSLRKRPEVWDDLRFLTHARTGIVKTGWRFFLALITIMAGGFAYGMLLAFKAWIDLLIGKPHP